MLADGERIGPYTLLKRIGQGAFGEVWLAKRSGELATIHVALKFPITNISLDEIKKEATLWATAGGHSNVLPIIDADIYGGHVVIASEYAPDGSLKEWLDRHGKAAPPLEAALQMTLGILNGLEHLHAKRIIHRDLKPENILLQGNTPRLADFGLSRLIMSDNERSISGTPAYMAPEAFVGKRNERTDLWAVGVILYRLVSGRLPFKAKDGLSLPDLILNHPPAPLDPVLPDGVRALIASSLSKNPKRRPASAAQMRAQLQEVIKHLNDSGGAELDKPSWLTWVVAAGVVIALIAAAVLIFRRPEVQKLSTYEYKTVQIDGAGKVIDRPLGQASYFAEDLGGGVMLEMVRVPGDRFQMGSPPGTAPNPTEYPTHDVTIPDFYIGKFEVTQSQWRAIAGIPNGLTPDPSSFKGDDLPVEQVSWDHARTFCALLSRKTGRNYRLPSEAEWEYACRARTSTPFPFGETITPELVNYDATKPYNNVLPHNTRGRTTVVGSLGVANKFGLYDMLGNVEEWCQDSWHGSYHGKPPLNGGSWTDGGDETRVFRGGSWNRSAFYCRSAHRTSYPPNYQDNSIGFRVVVEAKGSLQ